MKKLMNILSVVLIVLIVVQLGLMFLPYFSFEIPKVEGKSAFSMQEYAWIYCEEMTQYFEDVIDGYKINDYAMNLVLAFLMGIVALLFNLFSHKRGVFTHAFSLAWGVVAPIALMTADILTYGNTVIQMVSIVVCFAGLAVAAVRLYAWIRVWQQKRKALLAA